jgi:pentatricopeptide repeat protein
MGDLIYISGMNSEGKIKEAIAVFKELQIPILNIV